MTESNRLWLRSIGTMIGAIIGIGVFGIPYAFAQAGFFVGLAELLVVGLLIILLQLQYAEVTIETPGHRRLSGLAEKHLGKKWKPWVALLIFSVAWGAMTAYIIVAGEFLYTLLGPTIGGSPFIYSIGFFVLESIFLLWSLKRISGAEVYVVAILLILFGAIVAVGLPSIEPANLLNVNLSKLILPYGVVLFAMAGLSIIPEMHDILGAKYEMRLRSAVVIAMLVIIAVYALFGLAVVGVTGGVTSDEAIRGLGQVLGPTVSMLGSLLGIITLVSIFMIVGIVVKDTVMVDFKVNKWLAWFVTVSVPIVLFLLGVREFITVISFSGAVFGALTAVVVILVYEKMRPSIEKRKDSLILPKYLSYVLGAVFLFGAIVSIIDTFSG
ncbi:MAG: aromatic amino acid transport family protein [Candidatus Uhrbacteria bacterium]|nr:amino acid permease [Patescibacteria group bacterium]MBU1907284.1 amino acid permease [Patescibacteria group bacterium]